MVSPQFSLECQLCASQGLWWSWSLLFPQNLAQADVEVLAQGMNETLGGGGHHVPGQAKHNYPGDCAQRGQWADSIRPRGLLRAGVIYESPKGGATWGWPGGGLTWLDLQPLQDPVFGGWESPPTLPLCFPGAASSAPATGLCQGTG